MPDIAETDSYRMLCEDSARQNPRGEQGAMPATATKPETTPAGQPPAVDQPKHPLHALTTFELSNYRRQIENAITFFGTKDPVPPAREDLQAALDAVTAEQESHQAQPCLTPAVTSTWDRTRYASLALARPSSPTHRPILAHLGAIDTELARQAASTRITGSSSLAAPGDDGSLLTASPHGPPPECATADNHHIK